jgi:hypothetical protein
MLCPACSGVEMFVLEFERVELDYCPQCRGVWLDSGELELIGARAGVLQDGLLSALDKREQGTAGAKRPCPVCGKGLREVETDPPASVLVDRCPRGHGLWFDRDELPTVIRAAGAARDNVLTRFLAELAGPERNPDNA